MAMTSSYRIAVREESQIGAARRCVTEVCARLCMDEIFCGKAAILVTEIARNVLLHGKGGEIIMHQAAPPAAPGLDLIAVDQGPGLRDLAECLRDGFSTTGSTGSGLGAIQRLSDRFEVFSRPGQGTVAWIRLYTPNAGAVAHAFESGGISVAIEREKRCGDGWEVHETNGVLRALVVDGLGHGQFAEEASREAISVFRSQMGTGVGPTLKLIDQALIKTRGAAGAIVELNPREGHIVAAGIGNISMRLLQNGRVKSFGCDNGTLGAGVKRITELRHPWVDRSFLVMHSDGIKARWSLDDYPGVFRKHPGLIAGLLYRDFQRGGDDATVIVVRHNV
jgi:anti-sigma regulatory factor (Ser/Thr protein kinase)